MKKSFFQENAFWRNQEKTEAMSIYCIEQDDGTVDRRQQPVPKFVDDKINPLWTQLMEEIGPKKLDENTEQRRKEKITKANETNLKQKQREKSVKLEELFAQKLKAFEIQEVRECKDKRVRTKIRAAKNEVEMNAWIAVAFMKSLEEEDE